jgi:hypothetical protein
MKKTVAKKTSGAKKEAATSCESLALRVAALERIIGTIVAGAASRKALNEMLRLSCELTQAEAGTVMILDWPSGMLVFDAVRGAAAVKLQNFRMSVKGGDCGWVPGTGKPFWFPL